MIKCIKRIGVTVIVLVAVAVLLVNAIVLGVSQSKIHSVEELSAQQVQTDYIVVLGASVLPDGTLSDILEDRVDAGIAAYEAGLAPVILMSGDGRTSNYNEPEAMRQYALAQGVPDYAIACDPAGHRTYDSMWRVAHIYDAQSAIVVTQEFHLPRAMASLIGMNVRTYGIASDTGVYEQELWYNIREIPGRVKDFVLTLLQQDPQVVPLTR